MHKHHSIFQNLQVSTTKKFLLHEKKEGKWEALLWVTHKEIFILILEVSYYLLKKLEVHCILF